MKRLINGALALTLMASLLSGCAGGKTVEPPDTQAAQPTRTEPVTQSPETVPETTQPEADQGWFRDTPAHQAFREALRMVHDQLYWPELEDSGRIELWDGDEAIEEEQFAVCDVDGDGEDELLISVANTYMAGMCEMIYGYDAETGGVRAEAQVFPSLLHYPGLLRVDSSHNQGYAGETLWPYGVYVYDAETDEYNWTYGVDGWDKTLADYDGYRQMSFPEDIDTEGEGFVYILQDEDGERMMNRADYAAWESALFAQLEPLEIPWQKMTAQNIGIG